MSTSSRRAPMSGAARAVQEVQELILAEGLRPGDLMPTEAELCERLEVSRSSVREAIRTLASLDIVEVRHGHGTFVGTMSLAPLVSGLVFRARLNVGNDLRTLREVVEVRIAIDQAIAQSVVALHHGTDLTALEALVEGMRARASRGEAFPAEDSAFHAELVAPLGNELIQQLSEAFWQIHTAATPLLGVGRAEDIMVTVDAHQSMLDAIAAGDVDAYRAAILAHYRPLEKVLADMAADSRDSRSV